MTLYHLARHPDALRAVERALELAPGLEQARRLEERMREAGTLTTPSPRPDTGPSTRE